MKKVIKKLKEIDELFILHKEEPTIGERPDDAICVWQIDEKFDELKNLLGEELKETLGGVLNLRDPKPWTDDEAPRIISEEKCWEICKALRNWLGVK